MIIRIRHLQEHDFEFYYRCYANEEFKRCIYGHKNLEIKNLFEKLIDDNNGRCESYLVLKNNVFNSSYITIGFCSFLIRDTYPFEVIQNTYTISGGLDPSIFNSGYGIYACVSMIKFFFEKHPKSLLYASTFDFNIRSTKMLTALGFKQFNQKWYGKNHFILDGNSFINNGFVERLLSHVVIEASL